MVIWIKPVTRRSLVTLKSVTKLDLPFLYELLKQRKPNVNISHKKMPTYDQHVRFVMSKPYSKWYIIKFNDQRVGSAYLTRQNEIGIFILNNMSGIGIGTIALKTLMEKNPRGRYLANVNPKNKKSIKFFRQHGFNLIQHTYESTKIKK